MVLATSLPSGPTLLPITNFAVRHSPLGNTMLINGMIRSAANDETTFPTAPPTITATARASTLFFSRNSLKPLIIDPSLTQEFCETVHGRFQDTPFGGVADAERAFAALAERDSGGEADAGLGEEAAAEV